MHWLPIRIRSACVSLAQLIILAVVCVVAIAVRYTITDKDMDGY